MQVVFPNQEGCYVSAVSKTYGIFQKAVCCGEQAMYEAHL